MDVAELIRERLREVYDPELGVNVVDLGLVYDIREEPDRVRVIMTLTTPGCPLHDAIVGAARRALWQALPDRPVDVELVWEPRWTPDRMSDAAKEQLGLW